MLKQYTAPLSIFIVSLFLFTWGVNSQEIISFDSRFYLFALEMWRHGISWFPTTYLEPYPDYTVASTVLIYGAASLFGGLTKFTAVLPSAIAAAITVVLTYEIGALKNKRWGWYAVAWLLFTFMFIKSARGIALDMYPCLMTTACFYIMCLSKKRWLIFPLFILGFIFRGPIGLVMPTGVVCMYYLLDRQVRQFFLTGFIAFSLLMLCTAGLLYLAWQTGGAAFMQDVFQMQIGGRIDSQLLPFYFYLTNSFVNYALSYPFALLVIAGIFFYRNKLDDYPFLLKLTGWALVIIIGMSIPGEKKVRYILPMVPALALLAAYPLAVIPKKIYFTCLRTTMTLLFLFLPTLFLITLLYIKHATALSNLFASIPASMLIFFSAMQIISLFFYFKNAAFKIRQLNTTLICALLSFLIADYSLIEPIEQAIERGKDFVIQIETQRHKQNATLIFYRERKDALPIKYMANMPQEKMPVFLNSSDELQAYRARAYFITSKSNFDALTLKQKRRYKIISTGKFGHVDVVVFINF